MAWFSIVTGGGFRSLWVAGLWWNTHVELVLVLEPLGVDTPGTFEPQSGNLLHAVGEHRQAPFQVTHDPAQDRPLALEHLSHPPVLFGVGVATGPPLEAAAFLLEGLALHHTRPFGDQHQLAPGHTSSSRLSVGKAIAFSCIVESTMTRSRSCEAMAFSDTAVSTVLARSSSTPASPSA